MKLRQKLFLAITGILIVGYGFIGSWNAIRSNNSTAATDNTTKQTKTTLIIGLEGTYKPYSYVKNKKLTGFEVELGKAVAKKMRLKAKFVPTKWDSLIAGLGARKFDVVMNNISRTPERAKQYNFSVPYIKSRYVLIVPKNSNIKNLADIKGKKMAASTGTNNAAIIKKYDGIITPSDEFSNSLSMIRQGRVAGAINSREAWYDYKKSGSTKGLKIIDISKQEAPVSISALFNKKDTALQKSYNCAMKQLEKDGTVKKLSQKYFNADITK